MKDKYKYHVSYICRNESGPSIGRQIITTKKKITSGIDLQYVEAFIAGTGDKDPVILNYILMDTKWGFWEWLTAIAELGMLVLCILAIIASFFV